MTDLALVFDGTLLCGDLARAGAGLELDDTLRTAIVISLFSDARAGDDDELPAGETDPRGWWGDVLGALPNDVTGSKLWLHLREKQLPSVLRVIEDDARKALGWLVEDGLAKRVECRATNPGAGRWLLRVDVERPDGTRADLSLDLLYGRAA